MWFVTVIAIIAAIGNACGKGWSFALWIITNSIWFIYNLFSFDYSQATQYFIFIVISILGLYNSIQHRGNCKPRLYNHHLEKNNKEPVLPMERTLHAVDTDLKLIKFFKYDDD